jgi:hypothetical protein
VPPLAKIGKDGSITYPANFIPGPNDLALGALWLPYWQIPPLHLKKNVPPGDLERLKTEFSTEGFKDALRVSRIVERERDILLIPINEGNLGQWRLIYSLAPKSAALPAIREFRSGE